MNKKKKIISYVATVLITSVISVTATASIMTNFGKNALVPRSFVDEYGKLYLLQNEIESQFYKKVDNKKLQESAYKGLFAGLDDVYSAYFTKEEMDKLTEQTSGEYVGLGIVVAPDKKANAIRVIGVFPNSPASKSGVKPGDLIVSVNGKKYGYQELDVAVKNMKGEEGSPVKVKFSRDGKDFVKDIKRAKIVMESVAGKVIDNNIGYIRIVGFEDNTAKEFEKTLNNLKKQNIKGLIIDLRDNGGGLLTSVNKIADDLLGEGVVVYTEDRSGEKTYYRSSSLRMVDLPIVVLTNNYTASASEILTGAIRDNKAGISIGTTTFGKGVVQSVYTLPDGTGYKVTTSQYFTPSGKSINKKGIKPDIVVTDKDKQLPEAIKYLKEHMK